jgi:Catalytic LigB subunit of aromatic ring-opening dioxygenase
VAQLVGVFNTAHSPFCYTTAEEWEVRRVKRQPFHPAVPQESIEVMNAKVERIDRAFQVLRERLAAARPDVLVVIGDDQREMFDLDNFPALAVYAGETFSGHTFGETDHHSVPGHPALAAFLTVGLMQAGFDPAFMLGVPPPSGGMCHAVMNPLGSLTDFTIPTVPVLLNAYFAPQMSGGRSYEVGRALSKLIAEFPADIRVAAIGSGGLWHTPMQPLSFVNEEFDRRGLGLLAAGDVLAWAEYFDSYEPDAADTSQCYRGHRDDTGLPATRGPQGGTREICNWIAAAAMADGAGYTIVDYVEVYASPASVAFAYVEL